MQAPMIKLEKILFKYVFFVMLLTGSITVFAKGSFDENLYSNYFEIADGYAEIKKYDKAIYFYNKASKNELYQNAAKYNIARMHGLNQNWTAAAKILSKLYKKEPENKMIYTAYAYALIASGKTEEGLEMYKLIYEKETENPEATLNYIRILIVAKKYDQANKTIEDAMIKFTANEEKQKLDSLKAKINQLINTDTETQPDDSK